MDRRPGWLVLISAAAWTVGLVAWLVGPAPYVWRPAPGDRWLWPSTASTSSTVDTVATVDRSYDVVVLDPFLAGSAEVAALHGGAHAAVCLLRAGIWEAARPDAGRLDRSLLGGAAAADARWLDIRRLDALADPLTDRLKLCAAKGFDGVVLSDLDGYANPTGFPLTGEDQRRFNSAVVELARGVGLRVAVVATGTTPIPSTVDVTVSRPASADAADSAGTSTTSGS